jgi:iron complex outermembrane recepter protein
MSKINQLSNAIKFALFIGATASLASVSAFAQEKEEVKEIGKVEVTGSRIKRSVDEESAQPVFVVSKEDIRAQGLTSVGDVIQNITTNGSTLNSTFNNGGNGETRVSLRNLGSNRTLVLVNGRRWVGGTGLGGAVDLNTIPTAAIERIEILKDGASTLYGSDAIAGVVNLIMRKDYEGAEANAYYGQYAKGDGSRKSIDATIGANSDRYRMLGGAGYVEEQPVFAGDRAISSEPIFGTGSAFGSSTTPEGRFALCNGTFNGATGLCSVTETRPNGTAGQFTYNTGQSGLNWRNRTGADIYNFAPDNYLITPQKRISVFAAGSFDINDNLTFAAQVQYNNRKSEQLLAAMPIVLGSGPGANTQSRTITISPNSIYNPFGVTVSRVQRRAVETGGRSFNQNVDTLGFNGGFEGNFQIGEKYFTWDAGMVYARNDQNDTTNGLFNVLALRNALGPSLLVNGVPTCVTTAGNAATAIAGCVPLNLLGAPGTITPEMLAYSSFVAHDEFQYKMRQLYANISGELFELPGGMMGFAFGLEKRSEFGFDQPDALIASGNTTGNARTPTRGGYDLDEAYLELSMPLLKDVSFAKELEISIASRYSDYSNFGNTTNSKFGFKWKPFDDLLVRGNWSEGFRAPSIAELFSGISDSFPQVNDPCNSNPAYGNVYATLNQTQRDRCTASGVPVGGYDQGNPQIRTDVGGNPNLGPEESVSKTFGFVYSPSYVEGLNIALDYWNIELTNAVTTFSAGFILNQCFVNGITEFCSVIQRAPGGNIIGLLSGPINIGKAVQDGLDLTVDYRFEVGNIGKFNINWDTTYYHNVEQDSDGDGVITPADGGNLVGQYFDRNNNWEFRSNLLTRWERGDFGATWFVRHYSDQVEPCGLAGTPFANLCSDPGISNKLGSATYHDFSAYMKLPWEGRVTVGLNNAFDKVAPYSTTTFANSFDPAYDIPGRFFYMQYSQKF